MGAENANIVVKKPFSEFNYQTDGTMLMHNRSLKMPIPKLSGTEIKKPTPVSLTPVRKEFVVKNIKQEAPLFSKSPNGMRIYP